MTDKNSLESFLTKARIESDVWERANIEWEKLQQIAADHETQIDQLGETAALFARVIQKFDKVHSVRWRVKDAEHLMEKIVRKRANSVGKYLAIDEHNYFEVITDLVGIRALHLFKDECFEIDEALRKVWPPTETPIAYIREGDHSEFTARLRDNGFEIKSHPAGYRSVHYVVASQPLTRRVFAEVQVRTIFEEGWSEIDHTVRYPNFSDNELVGYFLAIFNRMAGSADEMGGFVRGLTGTLEALGAELALAKDEKQKTVRDMERALSQLEAVKQQDAVSQTHISTLKAEIAKLKNAVGVSVLPEFMLAASGIADGRASTLDRKLIESTIGLAARAMLRDSPGSFGASAGEAVRRAAAKEAALDQARKLALGMVKPPIKKDDSEPK